jgi:hypothetical protein
MKFIAVHLAERENVIDEWRKFKKEDLHYR